MNDTRRKRLSRQSLAADVDKLYRTESLTNEELNAQRSESYWLHTPSKVTENNDFWLLNRDEIIEARSAKRFVLSRPIFEDQSDVVLEPTKLEFAPAAPTPRTPNTPSEISVKMSDPWVLFAPTDDCESCTPAIALTTEISTTSNFRFHNEGVDERYLVVVDKLLSPTTNQRRFVSDEQRRQILAVVEQANEIESRQSKRMESISTTKCATSTNFVGERPDVEQANEIEPRQSKPLNTISNNARYAASTTKKREYSEKSSKVIVPPKMKKRAHDPLVIPPKQASLCEKRLFSVCNDFNDSFVRSQVKFTLSSPQIADSQRNNEEALPQESSAKLESLSDTHEEETRKENREETKAQNQQQAKEAHNQEETSILFVEETAIQNAVTSEEKSRSATCDEKKVGEKEKLQVKERSVSCCTMM